MQDPPKFWEIRAGWYQIEGYWWLTRDALKIEFQATGKKIAEITLTTRKGGSNEGKLHTAVRFNRYNNRGFIVYSLDDMRRLMNYG